MILNLDNILWKNIFQNYFYGVLRDFETFTIKWSHYILTPGINNIPGISPFIVKVMNKVAMSNLSAAGSKKLPIIDCWFGKLRAIYPSI